MDYFLNLLKENSFVGALVSGILLIFIGFLFSYALKQYRSNRLYKILKKELKDRNSDFLSSHLLSSVTGYTQNQIEVLCSYHNKIKRNESEKESWRLM